LAFSWTCIRTAVPSASKKTSKWPCPELALAPSPMKESLTGNVTWTGGAAAADVATIPSGGATAGSTPGSGARPLLIELFC
jgi:hypothetical protein